MSSRRPALLMGVLLALLFAYLLVPFQKLSRRAFQPNSYPPPPALSGRNSVTGLTVTSTVSGIWMIHFTYYYTGRPQHVFLLSELMPQSAGKSAPAASGLTPRYIEHALRGTHHVSIPIPYPFGTRQTGGVTVLMRDPRTILVRQSVDQAIQWPDYPTWILNKRLAKDSPAQNLARATALVNSANRPALTRAKQILDRLLDANPKFYPAYIQLARVAMESDWGPEGLHQAHDLLDSALQIKPDSVNAKILLGYVYAHERHYRKATSMFREALVANPDNVWLWSNWGEMFQMRNDIPAAIREYRLAIAHHVPPGTHTRARKFAYRHLIALLKQRNDLNGVEALYRREIADFGPSGCYSIGYARFLLEDRGKAARAVELTEKAVSNNCNASAAKQILGLAAYMKWSSAHGSARRELLDKARIALPVDPRTLLLLAGSKWSAPALRELVAAGEDIDQKDNENLTALSLALVERDPAAVRRLVALGASPLAPVGSPGIPVALMPVFVNDLADVRLLRKLGVNYAKITYHGQTAIDFAERTNNTAMLKALGRRGIGL